MRKTQKTNRFQENSIQKKFSFVLIVVVVLILLFFSLLSISYHVHSLENELQEQLTDISDLSALTLPSSLWQFNDEYVNDFANSILLYKDIVFFKVAGKEKIITIKSRQGLLNKDFFYFQNSSDYITKENKIVHNNIEVGSVQIVMTRERIEKSISNNSFMAVLIILVTGIAIMITNLLLSRKYLFKPISKLEHATKLIAQGKFDTRIDVSSNDEIGKLGQSFNSMATKLQLTTTDIRNLKKVEKNLQVERDKLSDTYEQIQASLKEKEILLSEIHHRVKNNMQVIISMLRLQSNKTCDKKYAELLKDSERRVLSMSLVHEQLYQSKNFSNIDFKEYLKNLLTDLFISHGVDTSTVELIIDCTDVLLDLDNAIPCGLIVNELVSNCLKHAFPDNRKGKITLLVGSVSEEEFELTVSDDGVGIPQDLDISNIDSMGLRLVRVLIEDTFEGQMDLERTDGTRFKLKLKKVKYRKRI